MVEEEQTAALKAQQLRIEIETTEVGKRALNFFKRK